jgi:hypothetical protein
MFQPVMNLPMGYCLSTTAAPEVQKEGCTHGGLQAASCPVPSENAMQTTGLLLFMARPLHTAKVVGPKCALWKDVTVLSAG